jgi:hypothetical protein
MPNWFNAAAATAVSTAATLGLWAAPAAAATTEAHRYATH